MISQCGADLRIKPSPTIKFLHPVARIQPTFTGFKYDLLNLPLNWDHVIQMPSAFSSQVVAAVVVLFLPFVLRLTLLFLE